MLEDIYQHNESHTAFPFKSINSSQKVHRSINLNNPSSAVKSSNSKPLVYMTDHSESLNNLQLSVSSNNSLFPRSKSNSLFQGNQLKIQYTNPDANTTNNTQFYTRRSISQINDTSSFSRNQEQQEGKFVAVNTNAIQSIQSPERGDQSYKKPSSQKRSQCQMISPVQEIFQSEVAEWHFQESCFRGNQLLTLGPSAYSSKQQSRSMKNVVNKSNDKGELHKKVTVLIQENEKLIQINEELVNELQTVRKTTQANSSLSYTHLNDSKLVEQLKKEINQLHINQNKYVELNDMQKKQIQNLNRIIDDRQEQQDLMFDITNKMNQQQNQIEELKDLNQDLYERKLKISSENLLMKFELERQIKDYENQVKTIENLQQGYYQLGVQKNQWQDKLNVILNENERLNVILSERLQQADTFNNIIANLNEQMNQMKKIHQEDLLNMQLRLSQNIQQQEVQILRQSKEITSVKTLLTQKQTEMESAIITKEKESREKIVALEQSIIEKNMQTNKHYIKSKIQEVTNQMSQQEEQMRQKCKVFQTQMKEQYKSKLKKEYEKLISHNQSTRYLQSQLQQQQTYIENMQMQLQISQKENEQMRIVLKESRKLQEVGQQQGIDIVKQNQQAWDEERTHLINLFQQMQVKHGTVQNQLQVIIKDNLELRQMLGNKKNRSFSYGQPSHQIIQIRNITDHSDVDQNESLGLEKKYQMIQQNKDLNRQVFKNCTDLLNRAL